MCASSRPNILQNTGEAFPLWHYQTLILHTHIRRNKSEVSCPTLCSSTYQTQGKTDLENLYITTCDDIKGTLKEIYMKNQDSQRHQGTSPAVYKNRFGWCYYFPFFVVVLASTKNTKPAEPLALGKNTKL